MPPHTPPKYEKTKPYQLSSMSVFEVSADKGKCCIHAYHLKSCQLLPVISGWGLPSAHTYKDWSPYVVGIKNPERVERLSGSLLNIMVFSATNIFSYP